MKIKCIYNRLVELPQDLLAQAQSYKEIDEFHLTVGNEYIVYGMTVRLNDVWYYVCNRSSCLYPVWKPAPVFEVIDGRISRYWIFSFKKNVNYVKAYPIWTFFEWSINHPDYYDRLTDGEAKEVEIFKRYKELMDLEFPDISISDVAQIGDKDWLICPLCMDAWQSCNEKDAMVRCPKCKKMQHNPRYKNE